jgi:hypothetical protein
MKNWSNITLQEVEQITELQKLPNAIQSKAEIVKLLTGEDPTEWLVIDMLNRYNDVTEFMAAEPEPIKVGEIRIGDEVFKPLLNFSDWSTAKMVSYHNTLLSHPDNIALQVAILMEGDYTVSELERREELFRTKASYQVIYSLSLFFWNVLKTFVEATEAYLTPTMPMPSQTNTHPIGDGTSCLTQKHREIYSPSESC